MPPSSTRAKPLDTADSETPQVAVIAGRHCLAYQGSFCSTCRERCPVDGAVVIERGLPRIQPDLCTGCRICHELCPAPVNAILLVVRPAHRPQPPVPSDLRAVPALHPHATTSHG